MIKISLVFRMLFLVVAMNCYAFLCFFILVTLSTLVFKNLSGNYPVARPDNWQRLTLAALVLASKVWDDDPFENAELAQLCPLRQVGCFAPRVAQKRLYTAI